MGKKSSGTQTKMQPQRQLGHNGDGNEIPIMKALSRVLICSVAVAAVAHADAACTPVTINPGAVQMVRPHMSPATVSGVLGCAPTEIGPVWIWGVPGVDQAGATVHVAVVFDAAGGALSAQYQVIHPMAPLGNGALRVEPPLPPNGNWVPGTAMGTKP